MPQVRNQNLGMVADTESSGSLGGSSNAASDKAVDGSLDKRSQEKAPKKTHKAEREKLKRDQLNDLFVELSSMLDPERQNSGKATVLGDAARVLRDLVSQVESLRKEQSALLTERQYVGSEKNELQEENIMLRAQILELHNEICARMGNNHLNQSNLAMSQPVANNGSNSATQPVPHHIWGNGPNLAMVHPTNTLSPLHNQHHQSAGASQVYASRPQELQLFPGTSVSTERERSRAGSGSTPATSSGLTDSLPGQLRLSLPQSSQEESSSGSKKGRKKG
ncbi:transcription factor BHLH062-like isoform X1 [Oryza glaberrima]|uniref:BHLH domain-containing protein n=2 Tax=Oryza glaberrima TaxID=4538 RepID=I1R1G2_ORYGL|nr:transcription factor BHLH062-like isoform X1 [Oryza glaberrima]